MHSGNPENEEMPNLTDHLSDDRPGDVFTYEEFSMLSKFPDIDD